MRVLAVGFRHEVLECLSFEAQDDPHAEAFSPRAARVILVVRTLRNRGDRDARYARRGWQWKAEEASARYCSPRISRIVVPLLHLAIAAMNHEFG